MRINLKDVDKARAAIEKAQSRVKERRLDFDDVIRAAIAASDWFDDLGVTQTGRRGIKLEITKSFGCKPPARYNGIPKATYVTLEHGANGWFLTGIERRVARTVAKDGPIWNATLSPAAIEDIERRAPIVWRRAA